MPRIVLIFQLVYLNWKSTDWTELVRNGCPYVEFVTHHMGLQTGWNLMPIKSAGMGGKRSTLVTMRAVQKSWKVCWGFRTTSSSMKKIKKSGNVRHANKNSLMNLNCLDISPHTWTLNHINVQVKLALNSKRGLRVNRLWTDTWTSTRGTSLNVMYRGVLKVLLPTIISGTTRIWHMASHMSANTY